MWDIPDDNPEGKGFMAVIIIFLVVSQFMTLLRMWSRSICRVHLDGSDYVCIIASALNIGLVVIVWGAFSHGWGQDISLFTADDAVFSAVLFIAIDTIWNAATAAVRISMMLFYMRIFAIPRFRQLLWFLIGLNLASVFAVILSTAFICQPFYYSYNPTIPGGYCGDLVAFERFTAIWNLLADASVVILPLPLLKNLQIRKKKKMGLVVIFSMGAIICALTLTRIFLASYFDLDNNTKQNAPIALITALEPTIGNINACLPFLPAVSRHVSHSHAYRTWTRPFRSTAYGSGDGSTFGSSSHAKPFNEREMKPPLSSSRSHDPCKRLVEDPSSDVEMATFDRAYVGNRHLERDCVITGGEANSLQEGTGDRKRPQMPSVWNNSQGIQVTRDFTVSGGAF